MQGRAQLPGTMNGLTCLSAFSAAPCACLPSRPALSIFLHSVGRLPGLQHSPGGGSDRRAARTAVAPLAARGAAAQAAAATVAAAATQQQTMVSQLFAASTVYAMGVAAMVRTRPGCAAAAAAGEFTQARPGRLLASVAPGWRHPLLPPLLPLRLLLSLTGRLQNCCPVAAAVADGAAAKMVWHAAPGPLPARAGPAGSRVWPAARLVLAARQLKPHPARQPDGGT